MPKPYLTTNAPVVQVIDPVEVDFLKVLLGHGDIPAFNHCPHHLFERDLCSTRNSRKF